MKIFLLLFLIALAILFIGKNFFSSAKRNLFKDQAAWSGKDLKIKHRKSKDVKNIEKNNNYLKLIADESQIYLNDQSMKEKEEK